MKGDEGQVGFFTICHNTVCPPGKDSGLMIHSFMSNNLSTKINPYASTIFARRAYAIVDKSTRFHPHGPEGMHYCRKSLNFELPKPTTV
jgi:hypothetical protein